MPKHKKHRQFDTSKKSFYEGLVRKQETPLLGEKPQKTFRQLYYERQLAELKGSNPK